ncbi:MAG: carboxypeptidase-like regulatory domain-containing protein [Bacteroidetes bacterium]|nr:carboxypeptidase-like regulatory domain-containing protein [Bacteroidota bacterium]
MLVAHPFTARIARFLAIAGCVCLWVVPSRAQVALRGTVVDAVDGQPLPHATVQLAGSIRGTVSNAQGQFLITLPGLPATLEVRYIGYQSQRVEVSERDLAGIQIRMEPALLELDEVVVSGANPAEAMVLRAIQARDRMRQHVSGTYADVYTRFLLYSDFDLVQMNESVRATWWSPTGGHREVVRAERVQPVRSGTFRFAQPLPVPNFLDPDVLVLGARYAGPLHPDALELYQFTLGPTREYDGRRVMEIFFFPRNPTLPAFSGSMALLDSTWAVLQVNARPWPGTDVIPPVQTHDIVIEERFMSIGDTLWVPQSVVVQGSVTFGRAGVGYPPARYQQITGLSLHVVNPPVPDSLARPGPAEVRDPMLPYNNDLFRRNPSYIPATPLEAEQIATMDPTMTLHRAFRGEGLLASYTAVDVTEDTEPGETSTNPRLDLATRITGGDWFWYNRVDGWHPGAGYGGGIGDGGLWRVSGGYSIERRRPTYKSEVSVPWQLGPVRGFVGLQALDATAVVARAEGLGRFVPGMATYLGWDDLYDYYALRKQRMSLDVAMGPLPALVSVRLNNERHRSLEKLSDFNGWLFRNVQRENPSIVEGHLRSTEVGLLVGDRERVSLDLSWEQSPGWHLASDFRFTRLDARATARTTTFYRRRSRPNWMRVTVLGGTSDGSLPVQRQFSMSGSAGPFSEFAGFRSLPNGRFLADELLGIFWAHDFTTAPFEKLGLWGLAERGWGLHVFGGHAFSSDPDLGTFNGLHHEMGVGLSYPFGLPFRLDVAHGSAGGWYLKFGRPLR